MFRIQHIAPSQIGPGLRLRGDLSFQRGVVIGGAIQGTISTDGCVQVTPTGTVYGAVKSDAMVIEKGAQFEGYVTIGSGTGLFPKEKGGLFRRRHQA
ncbi:MAG: polymer-forming cytoskeletal protein [Candidatus Methylacidiphilales bacterium]|nr:polymer-forming cytoskeletal protein [Candidatus Methylacidiphilales bacterium]